jgi:hypothetical protein
MDADSTMALLVFCLTAGMSAQPVAPRPFLDESPSGSSVRRALYGKGLGPYSAAVVPSNGVEVSFNLGTS